MTERPLVPFLTGLCYAVAQIRAFVPWGTPERHRKLPACVIRKRYTTVDAASRASDVSSGSSSSFSKRRSVFPPS